MKTRKLTTILGFVFVAGCSQNFSDQPPLGGFRESSEGWMLEISQEGSRNTYSVGIIAEGCFGGVENALWDGGSRTLTSEDCQLSIHEEADGISISGTDECRMWHGAGCSFGGHYRIAETSSVDDVGDVKSINDGEFVDPSEHGQILGQWTVETLSNPIDGDRAVLQKIEGEKSGGIVKITTLACSDNQEAFFLRFGFDSYREGQYTGARFHSNACRFGGRVRALAKGRVRFGENSAELGCSPGFFVDESFPNLIVSTNFTSSDLSQFRFPLVSEFLSESGLLYFTIEDDPEVVGFLKACVDGVRD